MIEVTATGSFDNMETFLKAMADSNIFAKLERFGQMGVDALSAATPVDSGVTADSWYYEVIKDSGSWSIVWGNNHIEDGRPIAVLLQYGHATRTGGYVDGRDYINPALRPLFDQMANEAWKVVTSA